MKMKFSKHIQKHHKMIKEWAICHRKDLLIHGQDTNK